jgi:integrase
MDSPKATTLMLRYKAPDGWKRIPALYGGNGRIKPGWGVLDGEPVVVGQYRYEVRFYEDRKVRYTAVGRDANKAETERRRIEAQRSAMAVAVEAGLKIEEQTERRKLAATAAEYIADATARHAHEAAAQAKQVTAEFLRGCRKSFVDEVTREDVLRFHAALRNRGCAPRTVANKHVRLASYLRFGGMAKDKLPPEPSYEQQLPTIYTSAQIKRLLEKADAFMRIVVLLALKCGLREQELMYLEWADINLGEAVLQVRGKARWGFAVKDKEQREVPIPSDLIAKLRVWRKGRAKAALVLGNDRDRPNGHLLRLVKRLARNARLNCGNAWSFLSIASGAPT